MKKKNLAWGIMWPDGYINPYHLYLIKKTAIEQCSWSNCDGEKVVRVEIREVTKKKWLMENRRMRRSG